MARGLLRIYLGAAPGVGKTFAMLNEARRRSERGTDVVVGLVETHGRGHTADQLDGLATQARVRYDYRGASLEELDVEGLLARRPALVLVDELAHTNAPGARNAKRYQDIEELLAAGIDVISTVNIQHLESVNDVVERITGIRQQETVPDAWVRRADQIELVDMTPEALRRRMAHGNIYPAERIDAALGNYFRPGNLAALRELALLWVADRVEDQLQVYLETHDISGTWETRERVLVALTGAPGGEAVVRRASRIATRSRAELVAVYVVGGDGRSQRDAGPEFDRQRLLVDELGGTYREVVGDDVAAALVSVARAERATQLVIGASRRSRWHEVTSGSVVNKVVRLARDLDIHVISGDAEAPQPPPSRPSMRLPLSPLTRRRTTAAWVVLALGLPLVIGLTAPFNDEIGVAAALLSVLMVVVVVATLGGLVPGLVAAVGGALAANFFLVEPTGSLTISDPENALALVVFLAVAVIVATLVDRVARRSSEVRQARRDAEALARSATTLATQPDPLPQMLADLTATLGLDAVSLLHRAGGHSGPDEWTVVASAGDPAPRQPAEGERHALDHAGDLVAVLRGRSLIASDTALVDALLDHVAVAFGAAELQRAAAAAGALAEAEALRRGILQAVSHDLRTPLAGIKASVTSLLAPDVHFGPDDTREFLRTIDAEVDRLDRVVGNLLDMSRLQSGGLSVLRRPTALEEVVAAALSDPAMSDHPVSVVVPETLPLLDIDGALVERALVNVVANAIAVQPGDEPVRVEAAAVADRVHLRIVDRGPGIPAEQRSQVFEPFQRLGDRSTQAGVGLGMAIAQGFITATGGALDLDDTPGGGLTVTFRLPIYADASQEPGTVETGTVETGTVETGTVETGGAESEQAVVGGDTPGLAHRAAR